MLDSGKKEDQTEKAGYISQMAPTLKVSFKTESPNAKMDCTSILMALTIGEISKDHRQMELVDLYIATIKWFMMETGWTIGLMAMEHSDTGTEANTQGTFIMDLNMAKEYFAGLMAPYLQEIS